MTRILVALMLLALTSCQPLYAAQQVLPVAKPQFLDNQGVPLAGGILYTCQPGTTCGPGTSTLKTTYTDSTGLHPNPNPVTLDTAGRTNIWGTGYYKMALYDAAGMLIYTQDNISPSGTGLTGPQGPAGLGVDPSGHITVEGVTSTGATGTGKLVFDTNPVLGNVTAGTLDALLPVSITTALYTNPVTGSSGYLLNNAASPSSAVTYVLPVAAPGMHFCARNYTGRTGVLSVFPHDGGYIDYAGTLSTVSGYVQSTGALGDEACFVAVTSTTWIATAIKGSWSVH